MFSFDDVIMLSWVCRYGMDADFEGQNAVVKLGKMQYLRRCMYIRTLYSFSTNTDIIDTDFILWFQI